MRGETRFHALDGIRGVAALAVAAYHFVGGFPGFLAVDLFFVLSGFVIAMSYSERLKQGLGAAGFMILRLERLYPLWLIGCLVAVAGFVASGAAAAAPKWFAGITLANLLMLPAPAERWTFPLNIPGWSLSFEILVGLAFALGLWRLRTAALAALTVAAGAALIAMAAPPHFFDLGADWPTIWGGIPRTLYSFLAGVLIFRSGVAATRRVTWLAPVPIALSLLILLWTPPAALTGAVQGMSIMLLFPLLVCLAIRWEVPRVLERAAGLLGDMSYPVYVLHVPLLFIGEAAKTATGSVAAGLAVYLASVTLLALPAAMADRAVRGWLRRQRLSRGIAVVQTATQ